MATKKVVKSPAKPKKAKVEKVEKVEKEEVKAKAKVEKVEKVEVKAKAKDKGQYFYAVGKRKTAIAQVRIYPNEKGSEFVINDKKLEVYIPVERLAETAKSPIILTGHDGKFDVSVHVRGGGINAQAEAVRLGIARALIKFDETLRKSLRDLGFLTRDARKVER